MKKTKATRKPLLLDVRQVAEILGCSARHVARLAHEGRMPRPVHVGALARWRVAEIESWIEHGCRKVRKGR